jgi:hypothetical protein
MILDALISGGGSPFVTGIAIFIGLIAGMYILKLPTELTILVSIPLIFGIIISFVAGLEGLILIILGTFIGFFLLKIVRR